MFPAIIYFNKLALMGYSAGGHLALLYAYKAAKGELPYGDKIQLVISEAGPTDLTLGYFGYYAESKIDMFVNGTNGSRADVSPYCVVNGSIDKSIFPYTILAYGSGSKMEDNSSITNSDTLIPYDQATKLRDVLPINKRELFEFFKIQHKQFGLDANGNTQEIHPNNPKNNEAVCNYYVKIEGMLTGDN